MPDLPSQTESPREPVGRRVLTLRRRLEGAALGVVSGGAAGWIAVLVAGVHGSMQWWLIAGITSLAAALGYRFGRGVVAATFLSLVQGS